MTQDTTSVTGGLAAFLVFFALALVVWFLGWDLTRRLRRMRRKEEARLAVQQRMPAQHNDLAAERIDQPKASDESAGERGDGEPNLPR